MKITVFGDVHGNLVALEKLFELEQNKTDLFVCHGDVVNYGPWTNECITFLDSLDNIKLLKGNHENYYLAGAYDGQNAVAKSFFEFCYGKFNRDLINIVSEYEAQVLIPGFTVQHTIGNQYIFEDTDIKDLKINSNFIIGHSHQQFERSSDNFKLFNTGSIGQNRALINLSCYLKVDTEKNKVELKSFVHDITKVIKQMEYEKYPQKCVDYYKSKKRV